MYLAGYSINVLTLLAIVLAIGIVVDDPIVVMENIYVKVENGVPPVQAGLDGSKEIYFAIIATTITLIAVFFPIVFLQGITGRLFREFAIVMAGAVGISAFLALSLTPMVSTKMLRHETKHSWFYRKTDKFFNRLNDGYRNMLGSFLNNRKVTFVILFVSLGLIYFLWKNIPAEMAPLEDRSQISINTIAQEGSTYEFNLGYIDDIAKTITDLVPERDGIMSMVRGGGGFVRITLVNPKERDRTQQQIAD
jgi:multidrug efflux pump